MAARASHFQAAAVRAIRAYIVVAGPFLIATAQNTGPTDISAWKVALWSGVPALLTFLWRAFLDPSKIPSLKDVDQPAPDGQ